LEAVVALILDEGKLAERALLLHWTEPGTCTKMPAMTTHSLTGSAPARASGSAGGTTRDA